jgi:AraC family transcriptional regulator
VSDDNSRAGYEERIGRVIAYVFDHLDDELDLNRLADIACLSPHHWHRVYTAMRGETIAATVKRLRLSRAAALLAQTSLSVDTIARRSGYPNVQSFTRIFKAAYGMPPAMYRKQGTHMQFHSTSNGRHDVMYDITIKTVPPMTAITVEHIGPYMEIGRAFDTLFGVLATRKLIGADPRMVAIFYDDSTTVPAAKLRSRAGVVTDNSIAVDAPLALTTIAGGEYAVLRHKGHYADMKAAYGWLYGTWLPQSGRAPGSAPAWEEYLNSPRDTAPTELLTNICLPLA